MPIFHQRVSRIKTSWIITSEYHNKSYNRHTSPLCIKFHFSHNCKLTENKFVYLQIKARKLTRTIKMHWIRAHLVSEIKFTPPQPPRRRPHRAKIYRKN
jgi:hypothetical protein